MSAKQEARLDVLSRKLDTPIALLSKSMDRTSSAGDWSPWPRGLAARVAVKFCLRVTTVCHSRDWPLLIAVSLDCRSPSYFEMSAAVVPRRLAEPIESSQREPETTLEAVYKDIFES
jgi:hypothetical protein